jgi:hypothetical protein
LHKNAVLHLGQRRPKMVVEPVRAAQARKAAVVGAEAAADRRTRLHPVRRT